MQICTVLIVLNFDKILLMFIKKSLFFSFFKVNKKPSKNQNIELIALQQQQKNTHISFKVILLVWM